MADPQADLFHQQELRLAMVMNGGVSLAIWIGGVTQEINRLVRGESVYGRLCRGLYLKPRVDIISGTSAGGINGALLALAISQGKPLEPLRDIWLDCGDILALLRKPSESDPPSLLDGGYFYRAMADAFEKIRSQQGPGLLPADRVPIELTLTTTVLYGEVRDFPDDAGTVIRDVTHRGLLKFRRGPDLEKDDFAAPDIALKLSAAARCTASFPAAFEPFYLPGRQEKASAGGCPVPCLAGHANFNEEWQEGRYVVDGGVLDNNPLESAIEAVFRQRAEGEVRRVLAYVVPDPGHIPDPPSQDPERIPSIFSTALASLVSIPRVESVADQLRAVAEHNLRVSRQRDTRLLVARALEWTRAREVAEAVFESYRLRRLQSAAEYIAQALVKGAARHRDAGGQGVALGRRARERIADVLARMPDLPWLPRQFADALEEHTWRWGLITLENVMSLLLNMLRLGMALVPARRDGGSDELWQAFAQGRRGAYDLVAELAELRRRDQGHWEARGKALAPRLAALESGGRMDLESLMQVELGVWVGKIDQTDVGATLHPPRAFALLAHKIGTLFIASLPHLVHALQLGIPRRGADKYSDLHTLLGFLLPATPATLPDAWERLLTMEVVHYAFGANPTLDQHLELIQFSANVPTAFNGPNRLDQKLAGVQVAHFGAFYKRSWRINDWMFGRLDGAERLVHILLDPGRLARLYGDLPATAPGANIDAALQMLDEAVFHGLTREDDQAYLRQCWQARLPDMGRELAFLEPGDDRTGTLPETLPQCAAMVLERLHLDILRQELPALANAVGDDEVDGADRTGYGPKFYKRFRSALFPDDYRPDGRPPRIQVNSGLPTEQLVELFKGAKVGEEKILKEVGTDRFTLLATRSAAVAVSALSGKGAGLKWLGTVFKTLRVPLLALNVLVQALQKRGRLFISLYGMLMAASLMVLLSIPLAEAQWPDWAIYAAGLVLFAGLIVLRWRLPEILLGLLALAALAGLVVLCC
ncbi:MAG: patatin-like protein [Pseudomonadota bacterium]